MNRDSTEQNMASLTGLALTGVALILEPITGVSSLIARIAALGAAGVADNEMDKLGERTNSLEERIAALEQTRIPTQRLSGNRLRLLAYCLYRESTELAKFAEAGDAIATLNISASEYREAAEELEDLGLIIKDVGGPSGVARTRLKPLAFLSAAPALLPDVDLPGEIRKLFDVLSSPSEDRYLTGVTEIQKFTGIPLPRLDLILRALIDLRVLTGHGLGNDECGSYVYVGITPKARRVLRGEDPLPV